MTLPGMPPPVQPVSSTDAFSSKSGRSVISLFSETEQNKLISDLMEIDNFLVDQNAPIWNAVTRYWKLYFANRKDQRTESEKKWRANIWVPEPFVSVEARTAVQVDIITSADPPIQAEGIGEEDEDGKKFEKLFDYQLRGMGWRKFLLNAIRAGSIQGTEFSQLFWSVKQHSITVYPDKKASEDFGKSVFDAVMAGAPSPPDPVADPENFAQWRRTVNESGMARVGEPPIGGKQMVTSYRGPMLKRIPMPDIHLDPLVQEIQDQRVVIHRMMMPREWLITRTGQGDQFPFDPQQVQKAIDSNKQDSNRLSQYEQKIAQAIGLTRLNGADPLYSDAVELHACWMPRENGDFRYTMILNRAGIINKDPTRFYHWHGEIPIIAQRNIMVPGLCHGIGDLQQPEELFYELVALRNLRQDATTLSVFPAFQKLAGVGLPEALRKLTPGAIIPMSRLDAIKKLIDISVPAEAFREPMEIKSDIQNATATYPNVRGEAPSVGRVSATEQAQRLAHAAARIKLSAIQFDEDYDALPRQSFALWFQYGPSDLRIKIGGGPDAFLSYSKNDIAEAMAADYKFRGATKAVNREMLAQQLMTFADKYAGHMIPKEVRFLLSRVLDTLNIHGISKIISTEGTDTVEKMYELQRQVTELTAMLQLRQLQGQAMPAPNQVDPATADALMGSGQGGATTPQQMMAPTQARPMPPGKRGR